MTANAQAPYRKEGTSFWKEPSRTARTFETGIVGSFNFSCAFWDIGSTWQKTAWVQYQKHNLTMNVLFLDGHVEKANNTDFNQWQGDGRFIWRDL